MLELGGESSGSDAEVQHSDGTAGAYDTAGEYAPELGLTDTKLVPKIVCF